MIHRITLSAIVLRDYEKRGVFTRFHSQSQYPSRNDLSAQVGRDFLADILDDAERHSTVAVGYPILCREYVRLSQRAREMLRSDPAPLDIGRDGKSAAAGD